MGAIGYITNKMRAPVWAGSKDQLNPLKKDFWW